MKCEVPVGWTCKFESTLSSDQVMSILGGLAGVVVFIVLVVFFLYIIKR
jgi:hypothetical protein